jgi:hypothetical protein
MVVEDGIALGVGDAWIGPPGEQGVGDDVVVPYPGPDQHSPPVGIAPVDVRAPGHVSVQVEAVR